MGEKRHAKKVILIRRGNETTRKIEIFEGDLFPGKTFVDAIGEPVTPDRTDFYRIRLDGKWFPARRKMLYTKEQLNQLIVQLVGE